MSGGAGVLNVTTDHVVVKVGLWNLLPGVYGHLEDVSSRSDVSDVDPLTVNVSVVGVITTWTQTLSVRGAGEAAVVPWVTGSVLQTEACLVTLGYLPLSVDVQQLVQAEFVHAVEVMMTAVPLPGISRFTGQEVSRPLVLHPLRKPQQNSGVIVMGGTGGGGEAVLLSSTAEVVHGHSLDVGGDLDVVWIGNQIRETVLVVAGSVSMPGLCPGSGSVVRVVVVIIGVIVRSLVRVVRIVSDHHVLPSDRSRVSFVAGRRLLTHHRAQLRSAAGGGDPWGAPGRGGVSVVTAAEDDHRVTAAGRPGLPPAGRPVLGAAAQDAKNLPVMLPCQPPPERIIITCSLLSASTVQKTPEET